MEMLIALAIVATIAIYFKTLYWMIGSWIFNPYYSHGFLVLAISMYLVYKNLRDLKPGKPHPIGLIVFSSALIVHVFASIFDYSFLSAMSFPFAVLGLIFIFYGIEAKKLVFPILFLLFAVPYPIYAITNVLEVFSAKISADIVSFLGVKVQTVGAEIRLSRCAFVVGAPCSGIRSIIALLTVTALYCYMINDRFLVKGILILAAIPFAILANILRISIILLSAEFIGKDFALGIVHYASDLILFVIAVLALMGLRRCLNWMLRTTS